MSKKNEWLVQQLRISIFPDLENKFDPKLDMWPQVEGVDKEKETIDSKTGGVLYQGWFNKHKLALSVNPVKIDLLMVVPVPARIEKGTPVIEQFGAFSEGLTEFHLIVESWLENKNLPEINRLAFGAQLVKVATSRDEAYKMLSNYVPFDLDPIKMTDFNLQINLLTKSKVIKDLELNRLSKWSVVKITPELVMVSDPKSSHQYPAINLSLVELDINTDQKHKEKLDKKILLQLYSELVSLGGELSDKGVIDHAN